MNNRKKTHERIWRLTALGLLTALIVALQFLGTNFHIGPIPFSLVLVPITLGAVLLGPVSGGVLGLIFGLITLWGGISGSDTFTFTLFAASPFWTAFVCIVKGVLAGVVPGLIAKACGSKLTLGCILAAISAPIVNTGIFALCMLTVLRNSLLEFAAGADALIFLLTVLIGINFLVEFGLNAILSAAIARVVKAIQHGR